MHTLILTDIESAYMDTLDRYVATDCTHYYYSAIWSDDGHSLWCIFVKKSYYNYNDMIHHQQKKYAK